MEKFIINNFIFNKINILFVSTGITLTFFSMLAAVNYIRKKRKWYYLLNIIYIISFSLLIFTKNWLVFITEWEIVTVVTALMLLWTGRRIARQYFIIQFIGSSFLIYVILLAIESGYSHIVPIDETWLQNLFIIGMGTKSAIFGLHFWLPPVHATAPSPVSAILSGWVVKLGFIVMLKIIVGSNYLLFILGILMVFYGGIKALMSTDYKGLLAYSTISHLGFIALGIGSGTIYGYLGAIFHIIAHGLAKTTLFNGSGYWIKEYESKSIYKFDSALNRQRLNTFTTIIAFLSLMGLPLLAGYNSKYLVKHGYEGNEIITVLLYAASLITVFYGLRFFRLGLFKDIWHNSKINFSLNKFILNKKENYSLNIGEKLSVLIPVILIIFLGVYPDFLMLYLDKQVHNFHMIDGLIEIFLYIIIAVILLNSVDWFKVKERPLLSLDSYFKKSYNFIFSLSSRTVELDAKVFFENYLYNKIYNLSRSLYNKIYIDYQVQLFLISLFLLIL
ncbi:MAG: complex I subunit 5 family protein, partial [Bacillota bacterium]